MGTMWDEARLHETPSVRPAEGLEEPGIEAVFYAGPPWRGQATEVFAWVGVPAGDGPFPGVVLIHGGGGTAFPHWVRMWVERGYAAIAMDTCGHVPVGVGGTSERQPHGRGGPAGWGRIDRVGDPVEDQWMYHAVSAAALGLSQLASHDRVDAGRIGVHGISWGGVIACTLAGVDDRPRFVASSYGAGRFWRHGSFAERDGTEADARAWAAVWDPAHSLPAATMPMLWVSGPDDFAFPLPSQWESADLVGGEAVMSIRVGMAHNHEAGFAMPTVGGFADALIRGGEPLPRITGSGHDGRSLWATVVDAGVVGRAELAYTTDAGPWPERRWQAATASLDAEAGRVAAPAPAHATAACLNVFTAGGTAVSGRPVFDRRAESDET